MCDAICEKFNPLRDNNHSNCSGEYATYNELYIVAICFHQELQI